MVCPNNPSDCSGPQKRRKTLLTRNNDDDATSPASSSNPIVKRGNPDLSEIIDEIINATKSAKARIEKSRNQAKLATRIIYKRQEDTSSTSTVTSTHTHSALSTLSSTTTVSTEPESTETYTTTGTSTVSTSTAYATVTKTGTPNAVARNVSPFDSHVVIAMSWVSLVYLAVLILRVIKVVG
ncbi:hypothetical protein TWF481_010042 [Arthrobotrys musiformis]|uniref:Uncharacterized protein n=1 Tax=Arthrobotrys musiformis TaxID=47236 RepID=A0AAV9W1H1_9PEZI